MSIFYCTNYLGPQSRGLHKPKPPTMPLTKRAPALVAACCSARKSLHSCHRALPGAGAGTARVGVMPRRVLRGRSEVPAGAVPGLPAATAAAGASGAARGGGDTALNTSCMTNSSLGRFLALVGTGEWGCLGSSATAAAGGGAGAAAGAACGSHAICCVMGGSGGGGAGVPALALAATSARA